MLCTAGDLLEDIVVALADPIARGTDASARIERWRGGSAANVAFYAAACGQRVRFVGRVGEDAAGDSLSAELKAAGVDVHVQREGRTGAVVVLVEPGGERTMFPDRGAATELVDVDPGWLADVTWLHVPAYSLVAEPIGTAVAGMVTHVRAAGGRISVDLSSVGVVERVGRGRFGDIVSRCHPDIVFANADEAAAVDAVGGALFVVKHGAQPVVIHRPDGTQDAVGVPPVAGVVDSTGAGDAFAAGFLTSVMVGAADLDAARAGSALAARSLRVVGAGLAPD